ncbi:E3 ubiquitin-protein ligase XIAP-like [Ixodes scapularis]|uniref:E3 ubiquitin-protein ligase XIAP-like n=1 Tax=Ixodes scapularis TaxID=6945 RepID=UPI001C39452D|nr:E3 ubiquitin-protein ligase XIAP-like [Ixodes scapularis]
MFEALRSPRVQVFSILDCEEDDPWLLHARRSPNCVFLRVNKTYYYVHDAVEKFYRSEMYWASHFPEIDDLVKDPKFRNRTMSTLYTANLTHPLNVSAMSLLCLRTCLSTGDCSFDHDPTVAKVMSDFKTFATWPLRNSTPPPKDFAMAGLAYDPEKRILSCSMCQQKTQLSTIVASDETLPQGLHESDCDAPLRTLSPDVSAVVTERALAFRPEFQTYTARFASFDARPKEEDVFDVDYMASAGFYYLTDRTVECFCCGLRLLSWEADYDDPVEEHAKYNPRCPHLRLCASVTYIKEVSDVCRPVGEMGTCLVEPLSLWVIG